MRGKMQPNPRSLLDTLGIVIPATEPGTRTKTQHTPRHKDAANMAP